jgi:hypothetical protein
MKKEKSNTSETYSIKGKCHGCHACITWIIGYSTYCNQYSKSCKEALKECNYNQLKN